MNVMLFISNGTNNAMYYVYNIHEIKNSVCSIFFGLEDVVGLHLIILFLFILFHNGGRPLYRPMQGFILCLSRMLSLILMF